MAVASVLEEAQSHGHYERAVSFLEAMIGHAELFYELDAPTEPVLIYKGDDVCHNVLTVFARDTLGYKNALEEFDAWLPKLYAQMTDEDILIVDADHGCDPTFKGTDHTREYIPILMYGKGLKQGTDLGTRPTFADIGKTVEEYLLGSCVDDAKAIGKSFLQDIM